MTAGVAWQTVLWSVMVVASPMVVVWASTLPVEAAVVVGTVPMAEAALAAARTPPVALLAMWYESPAAGATATVLPWETFFREWAADLLLLTACPSAKKPYPTSSAGWEISVTGALTAETLSPPPTAKALRPMLSITPLGG